MFLHIQMCSQRVKLSDILGTRLDHTETNDVHGVKTDLRLTTSNQTALEHALRVEGINYNRRAVRVNPHAQGLAINV